MLEKDHRGMLYNVETPPKPPARYPPEPEPSSNQDTGRSIGALSKIVYKLARAGFSRKYKAFNRWMLNKVVNQIQ